FCIHIVRRGEDVVASIVDRARRFPDRFPRQQDPAYGIRQWNRSMGATWAAVKEPGHVVVVFEELVRDVETTLGRICEILGLDYEEGMAKPADPSSFTHEAEEWKSQISGGVKPASSKFGQIFDEGSRFRIAARLKTNLYEELRERAMRARGGVLVSGSAKP
ncbi:MAG: sulfotransferase, partial [Gemmatimonadota bacterium]